MCRGLNSSRPAVQTNITAPFTLISNSAFLVAFPTKAKVILYFSRTFLWPQKVVDIDFYCLEFGRFQTINLSLLAVLSV